VGGDIAMGQMPVTSLAQCRSLAAHHITQPTENIDIVRLVYSLIILRLLMVNDTSVLKENCRHHSHLALKLACIF
jgi:hypothetical protein